MKCCVCLYTKKQARNDEEEEEEEERKGKQIKSDIKKFLYFHNDFIFYLPSQL